MRELDIVVVDDRTHEVAASFDGLNEAREALARAGYQPVWYGGRESWTWRREVDGRAEYVHVDDREHYLADLEVCREAEAAGMTVDAYLQDGRSER